MVQVLKILLADDHAIIRRGLRNLVLSKYRDAEVSEVGSWAALQKHLAQVVPDVMVLDLQLGDRNAIDGLEGLRASHPGIRILVYSMNPEHLYAQRVLSLGCLGYLSKDSSEDELATALERVVQGRTYKSHAMEMRELAEVPGEEHAAGDPFTRLSTRELRVISEVLKGSGVKEIAAVMDLGPTTVATYKARSFNKLGVTNLVELQELAWLHGFDTIPGK